VAINLCIPFRSRVPYNFDFRISGFLNENGVENSFLNDLLDSLTVRNLIVIDGLVVIVIVTNFRFRVIDVSFCPR